MVDLVFLLPSGLGLRAVMLRVGFCSLSGMVSGMMKMPLCGVSVVRRRFVVA